jgi:hypothetical protein
LLDRKKEKKKKRKKKGEYKNGREEKRKLPTKCYPLE